MAAPTTGKLVVILHADVAGSTALVQRDEHRAHERITAAFQRLSQVIRSYGGQVHEVRGDALVAEFARASDAACAALAFQRDNTAQKETYDDDLAPAFRIGISLGEVVIADHTVTGAGVVLAQRVEQLAEAGGVCLTGAIHEALPQRLPVDQKNLGEQTLDGFEESVRVYSARLREGAELPKPDRPMSRRVSTTRWIAVVAAVVVGTTVGLLAWYEPWQPHVEPASLERMAFPLPDKPSIAVLAFDNLTQDSGQVSLADAMSESIITELSRFTELFVIARNSSFSYKGKPVKVQQVAEELGVRYVVEGSLQREDDRLRVNVQLIDALSSEHLWAERYDRQLEDFFTIQDEITGTVAATVSLKIEREERDRAARKHPANLAAFEAWLLGTKRWYKWTHEGNDEARELYEKAIELDPEMARGYLGMSWVYINGFRNGWTDVSREEALVKAREYAEKGLELEPFDYFSHQTMGYVHAQAGEHDKALAETERALELNPNADNVLADSAETLAYAGRTEEAVVRMKQAMRLNPHHPDWFYWSLGWVQYLAGNYEEALEAMQKMTREPDLARLELAIIYVRLGRLDDARATITELLEIEPDYTIVKQRLRMASKYKDPAVAEQIIADLRTAGLPEQHD